MINTYYILNWYCSSWWYFNIISPAWQFESIVNNCCHTLDDAIRWKNKKQFKCLPNCIKNSIIANKFQDYYGMKSLYNYIKTRQINEMAQNLSAFKDLVRNLHKQILENWCLVKWCDMYPDELTSKRLRNHWVTELKASMLKIVEIKLKSGNKDKAIKKEWIELYELNDATEVADNIRDKFNKEGLEKYINIISEECAKSALEICKVLSSNNKNLNDYIQGELG